MELSDTARAIEGLEEGQREALMLVAVGGLSHEDAAKICSTPAGTIKSRLSRARAALTSTLNGCKSIPPRSRMRTTDTTEHILGQLTAAASRGATSAPIS
jgi:RNA polymerase sigma-70 factor (ECF subfamily)